MARNGAPTSADYASLKVQFDALRAEVDMLKEESRRQRDELQIQFKRIAEMQAILDEERIANTRDSFQRRRRV